MRVLIREGSAARNLTTLITGLDEAKARYCSFCTDDKQPADILAEGHIDHNVRLAIRNGVDPVTAIQMATLNAATCHNLRGKGAVSPGYDADLVVLDDVHTFSVRQVVQERHPRRGGPSRRIFREERRHGSGNRHGAGTRFFRPTSAPSPEDGGSPG